MSQRHICYSPAPNIDVSAAWLMRRVSQLELRGCFRPVADVESVRFRVADPSFEVGIVVGGADIQLGWGNQDTAVVATLLFVFAFGVLAFARGTAAGEWLHQLLVLKPAIWLSQSPTRIAAHILTMLVFAGFLISGFELLFLTVDLFFVIGFLDFAMFAELAILLTLSGPVARVRVAISYALKTVASTLSKVRPGRRVRQRRLQRPRRFTANDDGDDQPAWPLARAA